jgi:hypothetical protein
MNKILFLCAKLMGGNKTFRVVRLVFLAVLAMLVLSGCGGRTVVKQPSSSPGRVENMGYTIQIGAFSHLDNAVKLNRSLERRGYAAYYFRHSSGLYKVRFGNFSTLKTAKKKAAELKRSGIVDAFYIVPPGSYPAAREHKNSTLREEIVRSARNYRGIPYRWGGSSVKTGFDCSGLTMAVYQLNGLNLPRNSRQQFKAGTPIARHHLKKGDLVFFATGKTRRVTHVGIYTGRGYFIHAPGKGKKIRTDKLTDAYYLSNFVGARTYL